MCVFFFKQKTAYEMRISDWSSDVCSSDLIRPRAKLSGLQAPPLPGGLPSTLLRRRPDIAQAELSLAASDATLDAARAQFLPSLRLTGSAGGLISDALPDPISIWSIGGSILAPLFAEIERASCRESVCQYV